MELWMRLGQPIEAVASDHERVLDAWEAGGVRGLVVGRMVFMPEIHDGVRAEAFYAFAPNPKIYQRMGVEPPPSPRHEFPEKRRQLDRMLESAKRRGWPVFIFEAAAGRGPGGEGSVIVDDISRRAYLARMQDTLEAFPMVDGAIMDGPEWGYEINGPRSNIFNDLPPIVAGKAAELGFDYSAMVAAAERLRKRLHAVTPDLVDRYSGGFLGMLGLLERDPDLVQWLRFRVEALTAFFQSVRSFTNTMGRPIKLGTDPRSASFAPLCGYDMGRLAGILDYLLPKHYFWHRGYDGLYGTAYRWVRALTEWNPDLTDESAIDFVRAFFGLELPGIHSLLDFESGFPPEFFTVTVARETRRAIAATGDPERVVPWVDVGRRPHDGDPMTAGHLKQILDAAAEKGLRRFLYHNHHHLSDAEWTVISSRCGTPWTGLTPDGYRPPDGYHVLPTAY